MQTYFANTPCFYCNIFHLLRWNISLKVALQNDKIIPLIHTTQILTKLRICQIKPSATSLQLWLCCILQCIKNVIMSPRNYQYASPNSQDTFTSVYSLCFGDIASNEGGGAQNNQNILQFWKKNVLSIMFKSHIWTPYKLKRLWKMFYKISVKKHPKRFADKIYEIKFATHRHYKAHRHPRNDRSLCLAS